MFNCIVCQGRVVDGSDIDWLRSIISEHPAWSRNRITKHICENWNWRTHAGQLKTFAARSFIDKLESKGFITLPPVRTHMRRVHRNPYPDVMPLAATPYRRLLFRCCAGYDHACRQWFI